MLKMKMSIESSEFFPSFRTVPFANLDIGESYNVYCMDNYTTAMLMAQICPSREQNNSKSNGC